MNRVRESMNKRVRLIYAWAFAAFTVVVGALFIWQTLDIYIGGLAAGQTSPFSREIVVGRINGVLAVPFWIWVAAIAVGFVLWEAFPVKEKIAPITDPRYVLKRLEKKLPAEAGEGLESTLAYVRGQQKLLKIIYGLLLSMVGVYLIYVITYMSVPSNFPNVDKTADMLNMAKFLLPVALIIFIGALLYVTAYKISAKKQLPYVKKLTAGVKAPSAVKQNKLMRIVTHKYFKLGVRIAVACLGVAFVIAGCFNGSIREVFNKAIRICTECIGLG